MEKTLIDLPTEIILTIADYVGPAGTANLRQTCMHMYLVFATNHYWKHFTNCFIKERYPPINPPHPSFAWRKSVLELTNERRIWSSDHAVRYATIYEAHLGPVDAVCLTKNADLVITGCRDRTIGIWETQDVIRSNTQIAKVYGIDSHSGWIWKLLERDDILYSSSWDKTVKMWDLKTSLIQLQTFVCDRAALSVCLTDTKGIAVGLYSGDVIFFDPRSGGLRERYSFHRKPVLQLESFEQSVFTISQDKKLAVFDLRFSRVLKKKIVNVDTMPLALSVCQDYVYVGDSWGCLHLFDARTFKKVHAYDLIPNGYRRQITDIIHGNGTILVATADGYVRLYTLTHPPRLLMAHYSGGEAITIDYKNHLIAVGKSNNQTDLLSHEKHPFFV